MAIADLAAFRKAESRTVLAQAKLTPTESSKLNDFVDYWREHGAPEANRSAAIRALVLDGLEAFDEFREEGVST